MHKSVCVVGGQRRQSRCLSIDDYKCKVGVEAIVEQKKKGEINHKRCPVMCQGLSLSDDDDDDNDNVLALVE